MTVFYILGLLFLALVIIVPLIERSNIRFSEQDVSKISRWILPLLVVLLVVQLLRYWF